MDPPVAPMSRNTSENQRVFGGLPTKEEKRQRQETTSLASCRRDAGGRSDAAARISLIGQGEPRHPPAWRRAAHRMGAGPNPTDPARHFLALLVRVNARQDLGTFGHLHRRHPLPSLRSHVRTALGDLHQHHLLFEKLAGRQPEPLGDLQQRRDLRIALAGLDPADLPGLDPGSLGELFLRQLAFFAGSPQVLAEVAHGEMVELGCSERHVKLYK